MLNLLDLIQETLSKNKLLLFEKIRMIGESIFGLKA